jgi:hypothetical protein
MLLVNVVQQAFAIIVQVFIQLLPRRRHHIPRRRHHLPQNRLLQVYLCNKNR